MSLTVLQKIIMNGVWSFFSYKIFKSQSKQCNLLFAFTTVKRMLSLLGLKTIGNRLLFMPRYFIKRSPISLFAVAVNPNTGVQLFNKERNSEMRLKASRNAAFPFFPIPLKEKKQHLIRPKLIPSIY